MKHEHVSKFLGVLIALLLSAAGLADDLETLIKDKKFGEAFTLAEGQSDKEAGDPKFDMMLGLAAREAGHPEKAYFAFERVLMANKRDARAHYEMALTLFKLSDYKGAKRELNKAMKFATSSTIKANASQLLALVETALNRQEKPLVLMQGSFDVGYNSNINSVAIDWLSLNLPKGPTGDGYINLGLAGFLEKKLSKKDSLYFSIATGYRKNFQSKTYDYNTLFARTGYQTAIGDLNLKIPASIELFVLCYNPALLAESFGFELEKEWNETHFVSLSALLKAKQFADKTDNQFLGDFELAYKGRYGHGEFGFDAKAFYNPTFSRGSNGYIGGAVKDEIGGLIRANWQFMRRHFVYAEGKYSNFSFWKTPTQGDPFRNDNYMAAQAGYRWRISDNFAIGPSYYFVYNLSNISAGTYMRHQVQLGLTGSF